MSEIIKLPNGKYRTRVYNSITKKQKCFTADTRAELKRLVAQFQSSTTDLHNGNVSVATAIASYIENRSAVLSPSTLRGYRQLQRTAYDSINPYSIAVITSEDVQGFVNQFSKTHSPKTTRNAYNLLIASILTLNPDKRINVTLPQKKVTERQIPDDEGIVCLLNNSDGYLRKSILLAAVAGMRRGEIAALKYEDIVGNVVHIHSDMVQGNNREWIIKDTPKTYASNRSIELPPKLIEELGVGEGRIIQVTPNAITQSFIKLRNKLGLKCRFHDLRHYAASCLHAIGVPDQYIMERFGWSSDGILKSVYRNVLDDKKNEFTARANDYASDNLLNF